MPSVNPRDLTPQGDPDTVVLFPDGALVGLKILGLGPGITVLGIREDVDGRPMSCGVMNSLHIEHPPAQSNPRRQPDESDDFSGGDEE